MTYEEFENKLNEFGDEYKESVKEVFLKVGKTIKEAEDSDMNNDTVMMIFATWCTKLDNVAAEVIESAMKEGVE